MIPVDRLINCCFCDHAIRNLEDRVSKLNHKADEEVGPAENYVVNEEFNQKEEYWKGMLVVADVDEDIVNYLLYNFVMGHH